MRKLLRGVVIVLLALAILQMADWVLLCDNRPPIFRMSHCDWTHMAVVEVGIKSIVA